MHVTNYTKLLINYILFRYLEMCEKARLVFIFLFMVIIGEINIVKGTAVSDAKVIAESAPWAYWYIKNKASGCALDHFM